MKKVRGYIFSRPFMGERAPQHVQNIVIRDFCKKNSLHYLLSATEYKMNNSFLILKNIINNIKNIDGIVAYSLFQLPQESKLRTMLLKKIIKKKKFISFAVEQRNINSYDDIETANKIWDIKNTIPMCLKIF